MKGGSLPTLSAAQIQQIVRLRQGGQTYKAVAKTVGCTRRQAIHYWRTSPFYSPAASGMPPTLSLAQIQHIIRLRQAGQTYKGIGRAVGCTPDQARRYWRTSPFYRGSNNKRSQERQRSSGQSKQRRAELSRLRQQRQLERERQQAEAALQTQIQEARAEIAANTVAAYKYRGPFGEPATPLAMVERQERGR